MMENGKKLGEVLLQEVRQCRHEVDGQREDIKALTNTITDLRVNNAERITGMETKIVAFERERDALRAERWQAKVALVAACVGPVVVYFLKSSP